MFNLPVSLNPLIEHLVPLLEVIEHVETGAVDIIKYALKLQLVIVRFHLCNDWLDRVDQLIDASAEDLRKDVNIVPDAVASLLLYLGLGESQEEADLLRLLEQVAIDE